MLFKNYSSLNRRAKILVLVALVIASLSCDRRPMKLPMKIGEMGETRDKSELSSTAEAEGASKNLVPVSSPDAANLVPMMDLEAAEALKLNKRWSGDLNQVGERRFIRALVAYNRITYHVDHARQRGVAYDALVEFEKELRARSDKGNLAPKIVIIPTSRDRLLPALAAGYGDIAIGTLVITSKRRKMVDFSDPILENVDELVVTGPSAPALTSLDDLSGKEVYARPTSSYHESLMALNERFHREGKKPVVIRPADEQLEDEDLIQMVDAGLIGITIVQDRVAKFWGQLYDRAKVREDLAVSRGGQLAWAIRKNSPELKRAINDFVRARRAGTAFGNEMLKRYLGDVDRLKNPTADNEIGRFRELADYFRRLDQNKWFDNVEIVASREIGRETVDYVSNIYKYYTAYRAVSDIRKRKLVYGTEKSETAH